MTELARLTWQEAEEALASARLALVPVGSCEQHGPHLALDTDLAVAEAFAGRLEEDLGPRALLCPSIPYGLSEHHLGFPGTLTLRPESFSGALLDVVESLDHWGLRRVLVVNGHGGNVDALRLVSRTARRDLGALVASVMWSTLASREIAELVDSPRYGHACEVETSVVMALAPDRLYPERIGEPGERPEGDPLTEPPRSVVDRSIWLDEWSSDGALGDPRRAEQALGDQVVDIAYGKALAFAERFAELPLPGGRGRRDGLRRGSDE